MVKDSKFTGYVISEMVKIGNEKQIVTSNWTMLLSQGKILSHTIQGLLTKVFE